MDFDMLSFCGMDYCSIDAGGRVKFNPGIVDDFTSKGSDIVLHCLPEGAIAVYPEEIYLQMREAVTDPAGKAANSFIFRQELRRFGAWTQSARLSPQGRITLPPAFREYAGIKPGEQIVIAGVEIGVELWSVSRWEAEQKRLMEHSMQKRDSEMAYDLNLPEGGTQ